MPSFGINVLCYKQSVTFDKSHPVEDSVSKASVLYVIKMLIAALHLLDRMPNWW